MAVTSRVRAEELDRADPLASFRDRVVIDDSDVIYLDGNSLGRLPRSTVGRLAAVVEQQWGAGLVGSWEDWVDLPAQVGDRLAASVLGAGPGEVLVADSTTVNLYKLAAAAIDARPGRSVIVTDDDNFPTDRYVLEGLAAARGLVVRLVASDPVEGLDPDLLAGALSDDVALVSFSHVAYRSGALADMAAVTAAVHSVGALVLWDLSHSVGSVPIDLEASGADLAVGCCYKYLNGGPGAPAFLYVRSALQPALRSPIWGWFGQRDQFAMGPAYEPAPGVQRFGAGTPPVLGLVAVDEGVGLVAEAGIERLWEKAVGLGGLVAELAVAWLGPLGFTLASPADPRRRGAHLSLAHPAGLRVARAMIDVSRVVPDFRPPDRVRLGPAPLYTRYVDVWDAMARVRDLVASGAHLGVEVAGLRVT